MLLFGKYYLFIIRKRNLRMVVMNLQKSRKYFSFYYKQKIMYLVSIMKHLS